MAKIITVITILVVLIVIFGTVSANEPLELTLSPCIASVCLTGSTMKTEICLNGKEAISKEVVVDSQAFANGPQTILVNYTQCKSFDTRLKNDLKDTEYTITAQVSPDENVGLFLSIQRWLKEQFHGNSVSQFKNYRDEATFKPKFPQIKITLTNPTCNPQTKILILEQIQIDQTESVYPPYDCKILIENRKFTNLEHGKFKLIYESSISSPEDKKKWESDYKSIDGIEGRSWLDVRMSIISSLDYMDPVIVPVCKVNSQDVIVEPQMQTLRCPITGGK